MTELRPSEEEWIASTLNKLPFVIWDRASFLMPPYIAKDRIRRWWLAVFGWIEREDAYKDFIAIDFEIHPQYGRIAGVISTSSKKHSKEAVELIMGKQAPHNDCFRVEEITGVRNSVKQKKAANLEGEGK